MSRPVHEASGSNISPLESLLAFVQRLSEDRSGGVLGDALSHALAGLGFLAGFAFEVAENGVTP